MKILGKNSQASYLVAIVLLQAGCATLLPQKEKQFVPKDAEHSLVKSMLISLPKEEGGSPSISVKLGGLVKATKGDTLPVLVLGISGLTSGLVTPEKDGRWQYTLFMPYPPEGTLWPTEPILISTIKKKSMEDKDLMYSRGESISFWSPLVVGLDLLLRGGKFVVERSDLLPIEAPSKGVGGRDVMESNWVSNKDLTDEIVCDVKTYVSKKNAQITEDEKRQAEIANKKAEMERINAEIAKKERMKQVRKDLREKYIFWTALKAKEVENGIKETYKNVLGQRIFEDVQIRERALYLFIPASRSDAIINANMKTFASLSEVFYVWCGCDGEVRVSVDLSYLGQGEEVLLKFKVNLETGRGELVW